MTPSSQEIGSPGNPGRFILIAAGSTQQRVVAHNEYDQDWSGSSKCLGKLTTNNTYPETGSGILMTEKRTYGEVGGRLSQLSQLPDWPGQATAVTIFHYDSRGELLPGALYR
jgi:hypothetical protein